MARHRSAAAASDFPFDGLICHYDMTTNVAGTLVLDQYGSIDGAISGAVDFAEAYGVNGIGAWSSSSDEYIDMGELSAYPDMTVAFWYKDNHVQGGAGSTMWGTGKNFGSFRWLLSRDVGATGVYYQVRCASAGYLTMVGDVFPRSEWQHIAASFDVTGGEVRFWHNGTLLSNKSATVSSPASNYPYYLLNALDGTTHETYGAQSYQDEFYMWNRILTDEEVQTVYEEFTP